MPSPRKARYIDVLTLPTVPRTFLTALIARSAYALVFLPLLFAVQASSGSLAVGGIAVAAYGATASLLGPLRGRLIDRRGRRRMLVFFALAFGAMLAVLGSAALVLAPGPVMIVLAALAGAVAPPIGPSMRVVWAELMPSPGALRTALSFDAVVEELLYLVGPALAGLALALVHPGVALFVPAILVVVGTMAFVSSPVFHRDGREPVAEPGSRAVDGAASARPTLLRNPGFVAVLLPAMLAGLVAGNISIAVPALFPGIEGAAVTGILLGLFAGGSALGGLVFGALRVPGTAGQQLFVICTGLVLASTAIAFANGAVWLGIIAVLAGLFFSPVMIVAYFAASSFGVDGRQTEATSWVNTSHNIGGSLGSALAGVVLQLAGVGAAFLVVAIVAVVLLAASRALRRPRPERNHGTDSAGKPQTAATKA